MKKIKILGKRKSYCNSCGKELCASLKDHNEMEGIANITIEWGYFSNKDGEIHKILLCEDCYDTWIKGFAIPVKVEEKKELLN